MIGVFAFAGVAGGHQMILLGCTTAEGEDRAFSSSSLSICPCSSRVASGPSELPRSPFRLESRSALYLLWNIEAPVQRRYIYSSEEMFRGAPVQRRCSEEMFRGAPPVVQKERLLNLDSEERSLNISSEQGPRNYRTERRYASEPRREPFQRRYRGPCSEGLDSGSMPLFRGLVLEHAARSRVPASRYAPVQSEVRSGQSEVRYAP